MKTGISDSDGASGAGQTQVRFTGMIGLQPLAILREIDRTGSLTDAADRLNLTQSAVSHAIRRFKERHRVKLWEREERKLRLTPKGEYLLGLAARVLPQLEHGADVTRRCHGAIIARGGTAIIPIRKDGRPWTEDCPAARARNEIPRATHHNGRAFWKRWTGYPARSRVAEKMRGLKSFDERIAARDPDRQTAEMHIRVALEQSLRRARHRRRRSRA